MHPNFMMTFLFFLKTPCRDSQGGHACDVDDPPKGKRQKKVEACVTIELERKAPSNHLVRMYAFHVVLDGCARMVAMSRRERMVAHDITDAPFLLAEMVRRRKFF